MNKLYYSAGSCSTSCHITLEESGIPYEAIEIDWKQTSDPNIALVEKLNPLGTLPVFITEEGKQLDQNISIHTYVADKAPGRKLLPPVGTVERAEAMNWLSFIASDLHKTIGGLFGVSGFSADKSTQEAVRKYFVTKSNELLKYLDSKLSGKDYLTGKDFTPADAYAYVVTGWTEWLEIPIDSLKNLQAYRSRISARPAVAKVLKVEGLI